MPRRKYATPEEAKAAERARRKHYRARTTPEQRERYKAQERERYATDPVYRAKQIEAAKARYQRLKDEARQKQESVGEGERQGLLHIQGP